VRLAEPFALTADEASRMTDDLLASVDGGPGRYSVHVAGGHEDGALLSLQVAADVFLEAFGNTADVLRREYAHLIPSMTHVVVLDRETRTAVGSLLLQESPAGELKTVVDLAGPPWSVPPEQTLPALALTAGDRTAADLLLLAVSPEHRNRGVAVLLLYAGWVVSAASGIDRWTAILDDSLLDGLNALTGGVLHAIAPSGPYLGSPASTPVTMRMRPAEDVDLLRLVQSVGAAVAVDTTFGPRLEEARRTFQSWV
jgi:ribosomal protein S18 acetylase RimI-like enzyme